MSNTRGTGWWDATWNPVGGCWAVSPGCKNCYAAKLAATQHVARRVELYDGITEWVGDVPVFNGNLSVLAPEHESWNSPLTWPGAPHPQLGDGQPSLIFVSDMCDLFHEDRPEPIINQVIGTLVASRHIGMLLTKRAERMAAYFAAPLPATVRQRRQQKLWLGFSAERQDWFDQRWSHMRALAVAGWTVFVSAAPLIGRVILPPDFLEHGARIWVICSGEQNTGHGTRPMDPAWARALRDQCAEAGTPFYMLQMAARERIPADLFVREFPSRDGSARKRNNSATKPRMARWKPPSAK